MKNLHLSSLLFSVIFFGFSTFSMAQSISSFTLVNAETNTDIAAIQNGNVYNLTAIGTDQLSIRVNVSAAVGSIVFFVDGQKFQTENISPYALAGDNSGNYNAWVPAMQTYAIQARAYSASNGTGSLLDSSSVAISFINEPLEVVVTDVNFINCPTINLMVGEVIDLDVEILPANATNQTIAFTASDGTSVNYLSGEFTASAPGQITVTATSFSDGSVFDQCIINIIEPIATINPFQVVQAEAYTGQSGTQMGGSGIAVGYIQNNDYIFFANVDFSNAALGGSVRASSNNQGGTIEWRKGSVNGELLATSPITNTGGWASFQDFAINLVNPGTSAGIVDLYLVFKGGSGYLFDVDQFIFSQEEIFVTDVSFINCPTAPLNVDDTVDLDVLIEPGSATNQTIAFTASDGLSVDYLSGVFIASAPGEITVTATSFSDGSVFDQCVITIAGVNPPAAPSDLDAAALAPGIISLSWTDNANDEESFEIERTFDAFSSAPQWTLLTSVAANSTIYIDSTVALEPYIAYRVRAVNSVGNSSFTDAVRVDNFPLAPTNFRAESITQTSIELAWDQPPYGNDYLIEFTTNLDSGFSFFDALYYGYEGLEYSGLQAGETYFFRIRVNFDAVPSAWSDTLTVTTLEDLSTLPAVVRINAGGSAITYGDSIFIADAYFAGNGKSYTNNGITDILGTSQDDIYKSERSTNASLQSFSYSIPVTNGEYSINLHFAEIYFGATNGGSGGTGNRVFSVSLEGENILLNFDLNAETNPMTALIRTFSTNVTDQELNIVFTASVNQPKVSAIEVFGEGSLLDPTPRCAWNGLANSALSKVEAQSVKVNDKLYVLAGFLSGLQITGATEIYDPATNNWSNGADMPVPVTHMGAAAIGNEIWIVAGFVGNHPGVATNKVQVYNTVTDSWSDGPELPNPRGSGAAVYSNGKLHFFGGLLPDRKTDVGEHYILDISNQAAGWQAAAAMPNPRNHLSGAAVEGKIYAIGGQFGHDGGVSDQAFLDVYDPTTDSWSSLTDLPSARSHFEPGTMVHNDKIIIVGGRRGGFFFDDVTEYNPATDSWSERCPLPDKLLAPAAKVFGDQLIVANGGIGGTCCPTNSTIWYPIEPEVSTNDPKVLGELKKWHKVTVQFEGPSTTEAATINPFLDYRLNVTFTNGSTTHIIPGYYAADGDAANTSATSGNLWEVNFSPDQTGEWTYQASFRQGAEVAISTDPNAGATTAFDGQSGSFNISASDKSGRDFRGKGRLSYVGEHYLQFAETGEYFIKAGADAPENTLAYADFDATPDKSGRRKSWSPHAIDFNLSDAADYTWGNSQGDGAGENGREILGMVNYLSGQGMNVFSFLTFSLNGDDGNVYPHLQETANATDWSNVSHTRFDVSKLAQWEKVFAYADKKGMYLHFKLQETENDQRMDGGQLSTERKLYYRELIARFGHHLALNWNLGEENDIWTELNDPNNDIVKSYADYISQIDPYRHNIVIHTYPGQQDEVYDPLLGSASQLTGASVQSGIGNIHNDVKKWVAASANAGKKWVVANDEQGSANAGVAVDADYPTANLPEARNVADNRADVRNKVLWGTLLAGGAGVEYYYGYQTGCDDLDCQDHRTRASKWKDAKIALAFFNNYLQPSLTAMASNDGLTADNGDYVFAKEGEIYVIYRPSGGSTSLNLANSVSNYEVKWYDPRNGGSLQNGSVQTITGGSTVAIGLPPSDTSSDWVALITAQDELPLNVLVYHETNGFRHNSINAGIAMVNEFASESGWNVDDSQNSDPFNAASLATYDVVVWMNTSGNNLLNNDEQAAFEQYIQAGGGFVGVHAATDTYRDGSWSWYNDLVGAIVQTSPNHTANNYNATMDVVGTHPAVSHLGSEWNKSEEYYYWELNGGYLFSGNINLLNVRSTGSQSYDAARPITWYKEFDGGRSFYTALGHNTSDYSGNSNFRTMMKEAIIWAAGDNSSSLRTVAANKERTSNEMTIYPNPASSEAFISTENMLSGETYQVQLIGFEGNLLKETTISSKDNSISLEGIGSGTYIVLMKGKSGFFEKQLLRVK